MPMTGRRRNQPTTQPHMIIKHPEGQNTNKSAFAKHTSLYQPDKKDTPQIYNLKAYQHQQ